MYEYSLLPEYFLKRLKCDDFIPECVPLPVLSSGVVLPILMNRISILLNFFRKRDSKCSLMHHVEFDIR